MSLHVWPKALSKVATYYLQRSSQVMTWQPTIPGEDKEMVWKTRGARSWMLNVVVVVVVVVVSVRHLCLFIVLDWVWLSYFQKGLFQSCVCFSSIGTLPFIRLSFRGDVWPLLNDLWGQFFDLMCFDQFVCMAYLHVLNNWICLFDAPNKFQEHSPKWWFNGGLSWYKVKRKQVTLNKSK